VGFAPTELDFDAWRAAYPTMTDEVRRAWDATCYLHWPEQAHGSLDAIRAFTAPGGKVLEVGGWRGDHAGACLKENPAIESWTNVEFCAEAARNPKTADPRYRVVVPHRFRWWEDRPSLEADVLVMSHVVEHLSVEDLCGLLDAVMAIPRVYAEAPLPEGGSSWHGYLGTHVLPVGWSTVEALFQERGWKVEERKGDGRVFRWKA
jgi:hypothetical protein